MSATRNKKYPNHSCVDSNLQPTGQLCYQCEKPPEAEQSTPEAGDVARFRISTHDNGYYCVSIPRYEGGEVVAAADYDRTARLAALVPRLERTLSEAHAWLAGLAMMTPEVNGLGLLIERVDAALNAISKERAE